MAAQPGRFVFRFRAFVSLSVFVSFLAMSISGIVLYIAPSGRIARDLDWRVWSLSRGDWTALHLTFSAVFMIAALIHLWLNRRPIWSYLKIKTKVAAGLRWEWLGVLVMAAVVTWGTLKPFEPFTTVLELRDRYRRNIPQQTAPPEAVAAGQITLEDYCRQLGVDLQAVLAALEKEYLITDKSDTLRKIADQNNTHPGRLRRLIETAAR